MNANVLNSERVRQLRDPRYASLWELAGPQTGLSKLSVAFVEVDPSATSPRHWHAVTEEIYMITEGSGLMYLDEKVVPISPGDCVTICTRVLHAIENCGDGPLRMWVATSPPYAEDDDFEIGG